MNTLRVAALALIFLLIQNVECQCSGSNILSLSATTTTVGTLTSKNYPSRYDNNLQCETDVTASGTNQVLFYLEYKSIEPRYDYLHIYTDITDLDKRLFDSDASYYSWSPEVFLSTGNKLIADFKTDSSLTLGGYKISYIAVDLVNQDSCGSTINATSSTQQLSKVYASSQTNPCTWTLVPIDTSGSSAVEVEILLLKGTFIVEDGGVTTEFMHPNQKYVSQSNPHSLTVSGDYDSDFVINYKQVLTTATGVFITTTPPADNSMCSSSSVTSGTAKQYLTSPNYPGQYPDYLECVITIEANDTSQSVMLNVTDFEVATGDYLNVYDGPSTTYNLLNGDIQTGSTFTSSGPSLTIKFSTNDFGQTRGFELSYESVDRESPQCSVVFSIESNVTCSSTEQTIQSPNYPGDYDGNDDKYWLVVKPSQSSNVVLDFRTFVVEYADNCVYDYVNIYDGACPTDPLLIKVCGYDPLTIEETTGMYILVHFHTDISVEKSGWELTHYIGSYVDPEADTSTDEGNGGLPDYVYTSIAVGVLMFITIAVVIFVYYRSKRRIGVGDGKQATKKRTTRQVLNEINTASSKEKVKEPKIKRKETKYHPKPNPPGPNATVININEQGPHPPPGHTDTDDVPPLLRTKEKLPEQNIAPASTGTGDHIPGQDVPPILNGTDKQLPEQNIAPASTGTTDQQTGQDVPPILIGSGTQVPGPNVAPASADAPSSNNYGIDLSLYTGPGVPPPFPYKTPAEARALGMHK